MKLKGDILPLMVLVKEHSKEVKTESGIFIPDIAQDPTMKGEVVVVGRSTPAIPMDDIEIGRTVLYHPRAGNEVRIDGENFRLMAYKDIFYIYPKE